MKQRKGRFAGIERLAREMQHDARILADRIQHDRLAELGHDLAHGADRLGFEPVQMRRQSMRDRRSFGCGRHGHPL
jgi:hypothetical protein